MLVLTAMVGNVTAADSPEPEMRLYYIIPFDVETYVGITEHNIEEEGRTVQFMFKNPFVQEVVRLLEAHPVTTSHLGWIRVKADLRPRGDVYLVDRDGVVLKKGSNTTFRLTRDEIKDLEGKLRNLIGVVDMEAYKYLRERK